MVTSNQKSTIDIYTKKKKSNTTLKSHQITREQKRKVRKKTYRNKSKTTNKMAIRPYIWVITLNVNGSNVPTERHTLAEWIQKQDLYIYCLQETQLGSRGTYRLKVVRGWKKVFHAKGNQRKAGVTILVSDKIDFKIKTVTRDKEGHYVMIKGSIQEDLTIINIYAANTGVL